jgi:hypothetical protein
MITVQAIEDIEASLAIVVLDNASIIIKNSGISYIA